MISITIQSDLDFTPKGKRTAKWVQTRTGFQHRWYVAGRLYKKGANPALTQAWIDNEGAADNCPQSWEELA